MVAPAQTLIWGSAADLDGDEIIYVEDQDKIVITGLSADSVVTHDRETGMVNIDSDGDGTVDASFMVSTDQAILARLSGLMVPR